MSKKDCDNHLQNITVMRFLLNEIENDCKTEGWTKGYKGSKGKKPVLDRLVEIRRLALSMHYKIRGEW